MSCSAVPSPKTVRVNPRRVSRAQRLACTSFSEGEQSRSRLRWLKLTCSGNNVARPQAPANPPSYSNDWGFFNGAQNDIFVKAATPAGDAAIVNPYATGTSKLEYVCLSKRKTVLFADSQGSQADRHCRPRRLESHGMHRRHPRQPLPH